MSCGEWRAHRQADDAALERLASRERWRNCPHCRRTVELLSGCNHITCKCGHEFCYVCGTSYTRAARARRAQAGCECALWDEENLLDEDGNQEAQAGQANLAPPVHFAVGAHVQRRQRQGEPLLQLRHDDDDETSSEEDDFEAIRGPWPVQSELEEQQERQQNLYNTPAEQRAQARWTPNHPFHKTTTCKHYPHCLNGRYCNFAHGNEELRARPY